MKKITRKPTKMLAKSRRRQPGGQPGNKNAMKHGFYSDRFRPDENQRLDDQEPTDVKSEIAFLRVQLDRLANQIKTSSPEDAEHYLRQLNTAALIAQGIATLARTDHLIHGKTGSVQDSILQALEEIRLEMGL